MVISELKEKKVAGGDGLEDEAWMFAIEKDQREIKGNY